MNILVTGSDGYIGSVLLPFLRDAGHEVVGLDTCYLSNRIFLRKMPEYELIQCDIRDVEVSQLKGFDAIVGLDKNFLSACCLQ